MYTWYNFAVPGPMHSVAGSSTAIRYRQTRRVEKLIRGFGERKHSDDSYYLHF